MTLIFSILTDNFIVQVSDRRLTRFDGSIHDDGTNKAVSWCGAFSIAFTGIAFIDRAQKKPTLEWIQETLRPARELQPGISLLQSGLQAKLSVLPNVWDKRLALSMVGWANLDGTITPVQVIVSNFHGNVGGVDTVFYKHQPTVEAFTMPLLARDKGMMFTSFGANVDPRTIRYLRKGLNRIIANRIIASGGNRASRAGHLAAQIVRLVADAKPTVGKDVTVMTMPKVNASPGAISTSAFGTPRASEATFEAISAKTHKRTTFSPAYVCGGLMLSNMTAKISADDREFGMRMQVSFPDMTGANPALPPPLSVPGQPSGIIIDVPDQFGPFMNPT